MTKTLTSGIPGPLGLVLLLLIACTLETFIALQQFVSPYALENADSWRWVVAIVRMALPVLAGIIGLNSVRVARQRSSTAAVAIAAVASSSLLMSGIALIVANAITFGSGSIYIVYPGFAFPYPAITDVGFLLDSLGWCAALLLCFVMIHSSPWREIGRWWIVLAVILVLFSLFMVSVALEPVTPYKAAPETSWAYVIVTSAYAMVDASAVTLAAILVVGRGVRRLGWEWRLTVGLVFAGMVCRAAGDVVTAYDVLGVMHAEPAVRAIAVPVGPEWSLFTLASVLLSFAVLGLAMQARQPAA